jgi:hypothetical protein
VRVGFACDQACVAHFVVNTVPRGIPRGASRPLTIASGTGRLRAGGSGTATLTFRGRLVFHAGQQLKLVISGYAVSGNSAPSPPRSVQLRLG